MKFLVVNTPALLLRLLLPLLMGFVFFASGWIWREIAGRRGGK